MKLPNTIKRSIALITIALAGASAASAIQIDMGTWESGSVGYYRANPRGDFESVLDNYALGKSTDGTWFGTFCIEKNEYFSNGDTYDVEINNGSIAGGRSGAVNGKDIISVGTAWLYKQYALGTLSGLNYANVDSLRSLQKAIWYLEGEIRIGQNPHSSFSSFINLAKTSLNLDLNGIKGDYTGNEIRVMNLTSNNRQNRHQDQLVYNPVPDSGTTATLLGAAFLTLIAIRRRNS